MSRAQVGAQKSARREWNADKVSCPGSIIPEAAVEWLLLQSSPGAHSATSTGGAFNAVLHQTSAREPRENSIQSRHLPFLEESRPLKLAVYVPALLDRMIIYPCRLPTGKSSSEPSELLAADPVFLSRLSDASRRKLREEPRGRFNDSLRVRYSMEAFSHALIVI